MKAAVVSGVGAAQVVTLWWVVGLGEGVEGRYARAVCAMMGQMGLACAVDLMTSLFQITKSATAATALRWLSLLVPPMLPLVVWAAYFRLGGEARSASAYAVAATASLACALDFMLIGLHIGSTIHLMPVNEASRTPSSRYKQ